MRLSFLLTGPAPLSQGAAIALLHRRVAFPLPGVPLVFRWSRPKTYADSPTTSDGHLRKRRMQTGRTQKETAALLGVNAWTYYQVNGSWYSVTHGSGTNYIGED